MLVEVVKYVLLEKVLQIKKVILQDEIYQCIFGTLGSNNKSLIKDKAKCPRGHSNDHLPTPRGQPWTFG